MGNVVYNSISTLVSIPYSTTQYQGYALWEMLFTIVLVQSYLFHKAQRSSRDMRYGKCVVFAYFLLDYNACSVKSNRDTYIYIY